MELWLIFPTNIHEAHANFAFRMSLLGYGSFPVHLSASMELYTSVFLSRNWDLAQLVPKERRSPEESFEGVLRALKIMVYIVIFLVVFVCATVSQGAVLFLTTGLTKVNLLFYFLKDPYDLLLLPYTYT